MAKKSKEQTVDTTAPEGTHIVFTRKHQADLVKKVSKSKESKEKAEKNLEQWNEKSDKQKRAVIIKKIKKDLNKPLNQVKKLREIGNDIKAAVDENLKQYRIEAMIESYSKVLTSINTSLQEINILTEDHPDLIEDALPGGFIWDLANPMEMRNEEGLFVIETDYGVFEDTLEGS